MNRYLTVAAVALAGLVIGAPAAVAGPSAPAASTSSASVPTVLAARSSAGFGYAALGDSYSSGVGTRVYDPSSGPCQRSRLAYPSLAAAIQRQQLTFLACSGATTTDVQDNQIPSLPADTGLVTITVGGDDVGFTPVLQACSAGTPTDCDTAVATGVQAIKQTLPASLDATFNEIKNRAPGARLVVLGYPRLFGAGPCTAPGLPSSVARAEIDAGTDLLDTVLAQRAQIAGATFIDVRTRFSGHGTCAAPLRRWINPRTVPVSESYHPNIAGHALGYLPALLASSY